MFGKKKKYFTNTMFILYKKKKSIQLRYLVSKWEIIYVYIIKNYIYMCNFYIYIYYWQIVICYNISKLDESRRHINIYIYKYYGCTCIQSVLLELRIIRTIVHIITPFENLTSSRYKISRICIVVDSVRSCFPFLFLFFFLIRLI